MRLEIHVYDPEALVVAFRPFEIVEQAPLEEPGQPQAFARGPLGLLQVIADPLHAIQIEDAALGVDRIVAGAAVLGDVGLLDAVMLVVEAGAPVQGLRREGTISNDQHAIAVTVKTVMLAYCVCIGATDGL